MRYLLSFSLIIYCSIASFAECYNQSNSVSRTALLLYVPDSLMIYHKLTNVPVDEIDNIYSQYAYDKKNKKLYVDTFFGNYVITLNDNEAKQMKKDKSVPQVKEKDIANLVLSVNEAIDERFMKINKKRQKNIEDSISREKERVRQMEIQDSIVKENEQRRLIKYREQHDWHWLPIRKSDGTTVTLKCALCDKTTSYKDDAFKIITINNDTAYSMEVKSGFLDNVYLVFHCFEIPNELRTSDDYITYKTVFADSLALKPEYNKEFVEQLNNYSFYEYIEQLKKEAPYGFFNSWGWDDEYSTISFNFNYMNLNKRTIKYIDVYWKVTNDVGDVRKTGHFKGTGPLEQYESASWNWDYSSYFVAGDASNMKITKVIITYMNGQQQVLTGNKIKFN